MEFLDASWDFVRGVHAILNVSRSVMVRFSGDQGASVAGVRMGHCGPRLAMSPEGQGSQIWRPLSFLKKEHCDIGHSDEAGTQPRMAVLHRTMNHFPQACEGACDMIAMLWL
jgi:hypothetical protein